MVTGAAPTRHQHERLLDWDHFSDLVRIPDSPDAVQRTISTYFGEDGPSRPQPALTGPHRPQHRQGVPGVTYDSPELRGVHQALERLRLREEADRCVEGLPVLS